MMAGTLDITQDTRCACGDPFCTGCVEGVDMLLSGIWESIRDLEWKLAEAKMAAKQGELPVAPPPQQEPSREAGTWTK